LHAAEGLPAPRADAITETVRAERLEPLFSYLFIAVVGFYALASAAVERDAAPRPMRRNMPDPVPVILLSLLSVDRKEQGNGLGSHLLHDAIARGVGVAE
jgi:GNAT superfamily N-acetyltransferase